MTEATELTALRHYSAKIGGDPLLIQGAGGNTSVKLGPDMWIKASGTQLRNAVREDLFVSVDATGIAQAVRENPEAADRPQDFLRAGTLRPSIETCLHAILPHAVVIHVHCVSTISKAIRQDAVEVFSVALDGRNWAFVPYEKPGASLAAGVLRASVAQCDIYVLGNHGLLIGAASVAEAADLLAETVAAVSEPAVLSDNSSAGLEMIETGLGRFLAAPTGHPLNTVARSEYCCTQVSTSALFPDQVLFCGPDICVAGRVEDVGDALQAAELRYGKPPALFLLRDRGGYLRADISRTEADMARCVGDVMVRVPEATPLTFLSKSDCAALLNWDAEEYRHRLNASRS